MALQKNIKKILKPFHFTPSNLLMKITGQKAIFPFYHAISNKNPNHIKNLYSLKTTKEFISDLDYLLKFYKPVSIEDLHNHITEKNIITKPFFHLSFDDGLREIKNYVAPILKSRGIPASIFINSGFVDNKDLFHRFKASLIIEEFKTISNETIIKQIKSELAENNFTSENLKSVILKLTLQNNNILDKIGEILELNFNEFLINEKPYLSKDELLELSQNNFSIGAHSINHPEYYLINETEQIKQTTESINYIKTNFNQKINTFAFPFTDDKVSKHFFEEIYKNDIDISFGTAGLKNDEFYKNIQRIPFEENASAKEILKNEYLYYCAKSLFGKNTLKR